MRLLALLKMAKQKVSERNHDNAPARCCSERNKTNSPSKTKADGMERVEIL